MPILFPDETRDEPSFDDKIELRRQKSLLVRKKIDDDYKNNRDPIKEFFSLTCQSVKLSSPHLNLIAHLNTDALYKKAQTDGIPYFQYWTWIGATIQKEVLNQIAAKKKPDKPELDPKKKAANAKRRKTAMKEQLKKSMIENKKKTDKGKKEESKDLHKSIKDDTRSFFVNNKVSSSMVNTSDKKKLVTFAGPSTFAPPLITSSSVKKREKDK